MDGGPKIAEVAALVGDPARANMLTALMDGRALTASELAYLAGVSPQTASGHLGKLTDARLLALRTQGRRRYFRLASPHVGRMLESLMVVAEDGPARQRPWRGGETLRQARTCYDHMAGRLAVAIADAFVSHGYLALDEDAGALTETGRAFLQQTGIKIGPVVKRRPFCRPCLDWSERRPHLAGALGAALLRHALERRWVERIKDGRALLLTAEGRKGVLDAFGVDLPA